MAFEVGRTRVGDRHVAYALAGQGPTNPVLPPRDVSNIEIECVCDVD
jgi:hypothetical protein